MSPGVKKVSSLAQKFDDSNKRHTVSISNKTKERIDIFEKQGSSPTQPSAKDDSNVPILNRSNSSSVMIKPHSNNNLNRMSSSPNLSSSPKNHSPSSDHRISRNIKTNSSIRKTIGNFEQLTETGGNSPPTSSVSEKIARIERKPKQQSTTAFHHDRVKRNFNIRKNVSTADSKMTERFSKLLQQFENEKLDSSNYKEAMQLFERKSIRFTPSSSENWSNSEEDRLQELLRLLREEEMKRLELLENMIRKERESVQLPSSPVHSKSYSNVDYTTSSALTSPKPSTSTVTGTNIKTLHTSNLMDKIKQERNDFLNKELEKEKTNLPTTPTVQISGKPLKERPLPTPGTITSTPLNSFSNRTPRKSDVSPANSDPVDLQDFIEQKKKRLTMLPTNADDLFQMW